MTAHTPRVIIATTVLLMIGPSIGAAQSNPCGVWRVPQTDLVVTVALFAHDGAADGPMGQICRGDQNRLKPDERKDCVKILADKSETQQSLQPAVIELAKLVVEKVRAGK